METLNSHPAAAEQAEDRLGFEANLAELSSRFVHLSPGEVDREIEAGMQRIAEHLGIDYVVLCQWPSDPSGELVATHVYPEQPGPDSREPMVEARFPWTVRRMREGRRLVLGSLSELPPEAAVDAESARLRGLRSTLCLPLAVGGEPPVGVLAFHALRAERDWPETLVHRLDLMAQVFTHALARRRQDLSLRESEARLALAADAAEAGIWTFDDASGRFWLTDRACAIFGYAPGEVVDLERIETSVHPDDLERVRATIETAGGLSAAFDVEYRIRRQGDGQERWISTRGRRRRSPAGEPQGVMGVSIDVTARKAAEEGLRASEARLIAAADLAGLGFYQVDFGAGVSFIDTRLRALLGLPPDGELGLEAPKHLVERVHPDDSPGFMEQRRQLHDGSIEEANVEYRYLHPILGVRWHHQVARITERDAEGQALKTYGVIRDVTDRRQAEEGLRRSYEEIARLRDRLQAENDYLEAEIRATHPQTEITGKSPGILALLRQVEQVAPTTSTVLVNGETGTGKELVARAIHRQSRCSGKVMVKVNCAALPSGLVESELFGREKGAYTGALTRQIGRFEVADGSTLFLDEVGELPLEMQAKLLRVLETGEFERLGSPRTVKVNVRLIAATHRDLAADVRAGRFREDLYYRLAVFPIVVPPLRERSEDIPLLVWAILEELNQRMGKRVTRVPRPIMETLQRHPWPGNVRELRNVIERAVILAVSDTLAAPTLDQPLPEASSSPPQTSTLPVTSPPAITQSTLAESERELIVRALERAGWQVKGTRGAAAALGLKPSTLYGRMHKLGIRPRDRAGNGSL